MLAPELRAAIACRDGSPLLSSGFESSTPGLFFVGAGAVSSFGPLMRFIGIMAASPERTGALAICLARRPQSGPPQLPHGRCDIDRLQ
jgi:hypothetical protein